MAFPLAAPRLKTPDHVIEKLKVAIAADDMVTFEELLAAPQTHAKELSCIMKEALARDHAGAASKLIHHGRNVGYLDGQAAIAARAKNCLTAFLDSGWNLNKALSHATPSVLSHAVADREMVFWLLERGADLNKPAHIDITPLSFAVEKAAPDLLQELLDHSGDVKKGEVLQHALDRQTADVVTVLGMLLDRGAPLDGVMYEDHAGSFQLNFFFERHTPLCKAAAMGNVEAVRLLLERGADPGVQNSKGKTPLQCAERAGHKEVVEVLAKWPRTGDVGKHHLPKTPLLIERHEVWVKTKNLERNGTTVIVGDSHFAGFALDDPRGRRPPATNGASGDSKQTRESSGDIYRPVTGVQDAGMVGDHGVARRVADGPGGGPPATSDDGVASEHAKNALPTEDPVKRSPGCFHWMARWKRKRRSGKSMGTMA